MCNSSDRKEPSGLPRSNRDPWDILKWPEQLSLSEFLAQSAQVEREARATDLQQRTETWLSQVRTALTQLADAQPHLVALVQYLEDVSAHFGIEQEQAQTSTSCLFSTETFVGERVSEVESSITPVSATLAVFDFSQYLARKRSRGQFKP